MDPTTRVTLIVGTLIVAAIWGIVALTRSVRRTNKKISEILQKRIRDKDELIAHVSALLEHEPTKAVRTDPFMIVLLYGNSRIIHKRRSWNDLIMLVYEDERYVSIELVNGNIPGITLTNAEEWKISDIKSALRKWERLPEAQPT